MSRLVRLASGSLVALLMSGTVMTALAVDSADVLPLASMSATGSFLAGRQALDDLRTSDAAALFRNAAENDWTNPRVVERSFMAYAADGQIEESARMAGHLIEISGDNDLASLVIATEALKERRYSSAAKQLERVGGDTFAGITGSILRAWALIGDGKSDEAEKLLKTVGQGGLEDFLVFHRAIMAEVEGRDSDALALAKKAYDADPYVARVVEGYVRMLGNAGRFDEAEKVLADYAGQGLQHPLVDAVKVAIDKKQRPGPFATNVQSGAAEMYNSIGVALAREGSPDIAIAFLHLGMYLDPSADALDIVLGQLLDTADQHEAANAIYDGISQKSPMKAMAVVRVAENLDAMGDRKEALRQLGNIVAVNPNDIEALSSLGDMQRNDKQYAAAAETYTHLISVVGGEAPGDWRYYYVRGIAYERDKQWPLAEADFKKALQLNPKQPQVLNYLGYSWVDQGVNLVQALDMIKEAVAGAPNDGLIVDSLGWAYFRLGRYDEAVATLEQAVQMRPSDPEINDHLGDAYYRAGRKLEASFQWNIASSLDEDGQVKARVAKKKAGDLSVIGSTGDGAAPADQTQSAEQTSN